MIANRAFSIGLAIAAVAVGVPSVRAQEIPTKITVQNRSGDLPFSTSIGTDLERVDVGSGNLLITQPIISVPGRGLDYNFFLKYDARFLVVATRIDPNSGINYQEWQVGQNGWPITPDQEHEKVRVGWTTNRMRITGGTRTILCPFDTGTGGDVASLATYRILTDANGVKHRLAWQNLSNAGGCFGFTDIGPDLTGDGMWTRINNADVTLADGTIVTGTAGAAIESNVNSKDSNGNIRGSAPGSQDTLGRVPLTEQVNTNQVLYRVYDSSGVQRTFTVNLQDVSMATNFNLPCGTPGCTTVYEYVRTVKVVSSIVLPNGRSYSFQYNPAYAEITRIDLPTGGYITYTWATLYDEHRTHRYVASRTVHVGGQSHTWKFARTGSNEIYTTTVTDPDNNQQVYTSFHGAITSAKFYQGAATGTPLRQHQIGYAHDVNPWPTFPDDTIELQPVAMRPVSITTTLEDGSVSKKEFDYDSVTYNYHSCFENGSCVDSWGRYISTAYTTSRGNVREIREYGFGAGAPGALLRRKKNAYLHDSNSAYLTYNIVNRIVSQTICDGVVACNGNGDQSAQTQYEYDNYVSGENPLQGTSGAPQHDYTNYSTSFTTRGNITRVKKWRNTDGALLTTTYTYDDLGNIRAIKDPLGHIATYGYNDRWANSYCPPPSNSLAYVTDITNALNHRVQFTYYPCTALRQARKDENDILAGRAGVTSSYDLMGRLTQQNFPDGGQTTNTYTDVPPVKVATTTKITASMNLSSETEMDGLGRTKQTTLLSDPQGIVYTNTTYDAEGRVKTVSNPYRGMTEATYGLTETVYDPLGRVTKVKPPDGALNPDVNIITTAYSGNSTTVTDQAGKQRRSFTDALGRLIQVDEPGPSISGGTPGTGWANVSGSLQVIPAGNPTPGTGSVNITGSEQSAYVNIPEWGCILWDESGGCLEEGWVDNWQTVYDYGTVAITVNGQTKSAGYGSSSTGSSIAADLANAINADSGYPVTASTSGSVVNLTSQTTGPASNYSLSAYSYSNYPEYFDPPSFIPVPSGSTLTGGGDGTPAVYDSGSVWVTVNGATKTVSYGQGSTSTSVATAVRDAVNADSGYPVSASLSGSTINLTAKTSGTSTNYSLSGGSSTSQPGSFAQPSFAVAVSGLNLTGGTNPGDLIHSLFAPAITLYGYDVLGNLLRVDQKGNDADPANWRTRTFEYNSLSQLTRAVNPESGTMDYSYDNDGNLLSKVSPLPNQTNPAVTLTTSFEYDVLHRLKKKSYSDSTPLVKTAYDGVTYDGCSTPLSTANAVGRRTAMCDGAGSEAWSYESMGRVLTDRRTTNIITKDFTHTYNLDGSLATMVYPTSPARTITYSYSAAAQLVSAVDSANGINYATEAKYSPASGLCSLKNGASITSTFTFTNRLQPNRLHVTTTGAPVNPCAAPTQNANILDFTYAFNYGTANNGNVVQIANNLNTARTQNFTYDELNRIKTAATQGTSGTYAWGLTFGYDPWANLLSASVSQGNPPVLSVGVSTKNQITGVSGLDYDAAGNMWHEPGRTYTYDAENRMTNAVGVNYFYDGDGKRVKKDQASGATYDKLYWYGISADPVAESDLAGTITDEYVFFGGKRVARRQSGGTIHYYFADHLGSSRVVTSTAGAILEDSDYYPFGGERVVTDTTNNNYKFTGKERDTESGLDFFIARYYSSGYGRFLSPDEFTGGPVDAFSAGDPLPSSPLPYALISNPQSLNKYSYTYENPLNYVDPDGHDRMFHVMNAHKNTPPLTVASVQRGLDVAGFAPGPLGVIADALNTGISALRGKFGEAGVNAAAMIPVLGDTFKAGKMGLKATERGIVKETEVLKDMGLTKNTEKVVGSEGKSIPDFQTSNTVGEIKDAKRVSNTEQIRIQREAAQNSGRQHEVVTGTQTKVSKNATSGTKITRRDDLGPQ